MSLTRLSNNLRRSGATAVLVTAVTALAALLLLALASPAQAAAYRYWAYYTWTDGAWTFATAGPDQTDPADGAVEGWRFAITTEAGSPRVPRADGDFDAICSTTEAAAGKKRVAVVLDAGLADESPDGSQPPAARGACALVDDAASGAQVLAAVSTARVEGGLVCSLDDYPAQGCGEEVETEPPANPDAEVALAVPTDSTDGTDESGQADATPAEDADGAPWVGIALGGLLVAALAGAAYWTSRRGAHT